MDIEDVDQERGGRASDRRREVVCRTFGILAGLAPGRSLSEELIAERRDEARREAAADEDPAPAPGISDV
jgi:hypothetical protein